MFESERGGVQEWPFEAADRANVSGNAAVYAAQERIADHRMADCAQVDTNLVCASCQNGDARERQHSAKVFSRHDACHGLATPARAPALTSPGRDGGHPLSVCRITSDRLIDPPA